MTFHVKGTPLPLSEIELREANRLSRSRQPVVSISPAILKRLLQWYDLSYRMSEILGRMRWVMDDIKWIHR